MTAIAHNGIYSDFYALRMEIWDSAEPLVAKALALAILEHMRPDKLEAYPSRSRLARMCGISERTLERHWETVSRWIDIVKECGKRNLYRARVSACATELAEMLPEAPPAKMTGSLAGPPDKKHPTERQPVKMTGSHSDRYTTCQNGGYTTCQNGRSEDSKEDSKEDSIPPLGNAHVRELCNPSAWAMAAALSQPEREAQKDVGWGADGTLCAMNGFASWLAEKFPRVSLDAGLAIVATNIGEARQRMPAIQVKDRIINKFAYLESDEIGRDRRATARMQAAPPGGPPPAEHWRDKAAEKSRRISEALQRAAANFATEQACAV